MAWTTPITFVDGVVLTASQLNIHVRDNLLETAPSKASTVGGYFVTKRPRHIQEMSASTGVISTNEDTDSNTYTDVGNTVGPSATVETDDRAFVIVSARANLDVTAGSARVSHEVSGATDLEPTDRLSMKVEGTQFIQASYAVLRQGLTPGENTFTMKYRVTSGTGNFQNRRIIVIPGWCL